MKTGFCTKSFASVGKFLSELIEKTKHEDISSAEALDVWKILNLVKENRIKDPRCAEMLKLWYENVLALLKKGKRGHFIETLPTDLDFFRFWPWEALEGIKESLEMLTEREKQRKIQYRTDLSFENVSFTDVYLPDDRNEMVLYRCGLCDLLSGKSSSDDGPVFRTFDGKEIVRLSQKDDVTEDESDWIYDYVVWSHVQYDAFFDPSALNVWFNSVQKRLEEGKYGNFVTTVPVFYQGYLKELLRREDMYTTAIFYRDGKTTTIKRERSGMLKKYLPSPSQLIIKEVYDWFAFSSKEREEFFKGYSDLNSDTIKLEALKIVGLPFVAAGVASPSLGVILYDILSDDDTVREILTQKESPKRMPAVEALKITIEKIMERVAEREIKNELEADTDDSWTDVTR